MTAEPEKTKQAAIADAENRLETILAPGHTQFITIRADTLRVLVAATKQLVVEGGA
ncbi:MAG: hypothetical protein ABL901_01115 [Hyphomicrobiaceae bacterium]